MINEFNYLSLEELHLVTEKYYKHLHPVHKYKIMWAVRNLRLKKHKVIQAMKDELIL